MKFEIIKNKWGWWTGVILVVLDFYTGMCIFFCDASPSYFEKIVNSLGITYGFGILEYPIVFVLGFILGLILQKIYRRFK